MGKLINVTKDSYYYTQDTLDAKPFWMVCKVLDSKNIKEAGSFKLMTTSIFITKERQFRKKESACLKSYSRDYRNATPVEIYWLEECIKQNKFVSKKDVLENLLKNLSFDELLQLHNKHKQ